MRKPHIEDLPQHFEVEPDGTEVSVLDCEVSWSRRNGGTWVRARSPKADASMRHPRKAHVKVIRNGKKLPPVVVARSLGMTGWDATNQRFV